MKQILLTCSILLCLCSSQAYAQQSQLAFNQAAKQYIQGKNNQAKQTIYRGLAENPNDKKLRELLEKILEQEKQEQEQNSQNQNQQSEEKQEQNSDSKQGEQKDQQNQGNIPSQDNKEKKQPSDQPEKDGEEGLQKEDQESQKQKGEEEQKQSQDQLEGEQQTEENQQGKPGTPSDLKEAGQNDLSKEKAIMILEAMKNSEKQYLQQRKRRSDKKKDRSKPDW